MPETPAGGRFEAVLFDLLTGLLDSWTLWNDVAGDAELGRKWRAEYLRQTYAVGAYRPYEDLVAQSARDVDLDPALAERLAARWDDLAPWPEAPRVVADLSEHLTVGVVTNCSVSLGERAAARVGAPFDVVVTAEAAGFYKPRPEPYLLALENLGLPADRVLFVAGSRYDIAGAGSVGMPVWWHNHVGLDRGDVPAPLAEERSLDSLPGFVYRS